MRLSFILAAGKLIGAPFKLFRCTEEMVGGGLGNQPAIVEPLHEPNGANRQKQEQLSSQRFHEC